ncbi:MAG: hypothetical protein FGM58_00065 [Acidimicrobiia bacterium]|nr:hypothetical protein [Acidimicrobiia bacterium]
MADSVSQRSVATKRSTAGQPTYRRRIVAPFSTGAWSVGLVFGWMSLYPTLLPRAAVIQGVITALSTAIGLGIGTLLAWIVRSGFTLAARPVPTLPGRIGRRVVLGATVVALVIGLPWWLARQNAQRSLVSMERIGATSIVSVVVVALVVGAVLVFIGRSVAELVRRIDRRIVRYVPRWAAFVVTALIVVTVGTVFSQRVVWSGFVEWANSVYGTFDTGTPPGIEQPATTLRSGGPGSLVAWDTLGYEGRNFAGGGPTVAEIGAFVGAGRTVTEPIRAYVGIDSVGVPSDSPDLPQAQAERAVAELDRTGAWDRSVLAVVTVTGTGWVDPWFAAGLEYMNAGDTAIVATQYSFLPSWISFLVDLDKAAASGRATVDAVVARWRTLPVDDRPRLIVDGISLGTYGSEHAFDGPTLADSVGTALTDADGVLYAGPTFANPIWWQVVDGREPSSPVWHPRVGDGLRVTAMNPPGAADGSPDAVGGRLPGRNMVYLTQPSDPVTWSSVSALWSTPRWMRGPRGYDVPTDTQWFPVVTFVQQLFDLMAGFSTPPGHGHNYNASIVEGTAAVAAPDGWTAADSARLTDLLTATQP